MRVIYPNSLRFCCQFDLLEGKFWGRHPFPWLFSWFTKWHFRQFWHISSTYWMIFSEWVSKSFEEKFYLLFPIFAVNLTCCRANSEIAILFFDLFLGLRSDIAGSFGTCLADIAGVFLNELTTHVTGNLLFSFVFLQFNWTYERGFFVLAILSFQFFFGSKSNTFGRSAHIGVFPLNQLPNRFEST